MLFGKGGCHCPSRCRRYYTKWFRRSSKLRIRNGRVLQFSTVVDKAFSGRCRYRIWFMNRRYLGRCAPKGRSFSYIRCGTIGLLRTGSKHARRYSFRSGNSRSYKQRHRSIKTFRPSSSPVLSYTPSYGFSLRRGFSFRSDARVVTALSSFRSVRNNSNRTQPKKAIQKSRR